MGLRGRLGWFVEVTLGRVVLVLLGGRAFLRVYHLVNFFAKVLADDLRRLSSSGFSRRCSFLDRFDNLLAGSSVSFQSRNVVNKVALRDTFFLRSFFVYHFRFRVQHRINRQKCLVRLRLLHQSLILDDSARVMRDLRRRRIT